MQYRKLDSLRKLENNPRIMRDRQFTVLCNSIRDNPSFFEARPLVLSDRTGALIIIAGNQRYEAARELGLDKVPTFLLSGLTEAQEREITIRDNVVGAEWDMDALIAEYSLKNLVDWGVDLKADDLEGLLGIKEPKGGDKTLPEDTAYEVIVECGSEQEMAETYDKLREEGYQCRLSIF